MLLKKSASNVWFKKPWLCTVMVRFFMNQTLPATLHYSILTPKKILHYYFFPVKNLNAPYLLMIVHHGEAKRYIMNPSQPLSLPLLSIAIALWNTSKSSQSAADWGRKLIIALESRGQAAAMAFQKQQKEPSILQQSKQASRDKMLTWN